MPQMSPMWWLLLMMYFIYIMICLNSMIFFNYKSKPKFIKTNNYMNMNWKW
uniref:ATP synthase F0 subunit 8 n=1 Tax=Chudania hellerina TaxID=2840403 RepID=A0A8E8GTQ3_9HEMI|nr:ATP synthase F0 subunit 8 [Chudania hellerina]